MRLPVPADKSRLCEQCVGLCCRYYALEIDKPTTRREFDDLRWYLLHEDTSIFVEDGDWYIQVNRRCKALLPDDRCAIYADRPAICRGYKTSDCDWHADDYGYDHLFIEPQQLAAYAREYLARQRKRRAAKPSANGRLKKQARSRARRPIPLAAQGLLKSSGTRPGRFRPPANSNGTKRR